jgi:hypothetical protein
VDAGACVADVGVAAAGMAVGTSVAAGAWAAVVGVAAGDTPAAGVGAWLLHAVSQSRLASARAIGVNLRGGKRFLMVLSPII